MRDITDPFHQMWFRLTQEQKATRKRFLSANPACEFVEAFKGLERCFKESDLGLACYYVVKKVYDEEDSEGTLIFGKKALQLSSPDGSCMPIVCVLQMLVNSSSNLNRFDESLKYLTWAANKLEKLLDGDPCQDTDKSLLSLHQVYLQLYFLKNSMGTNEISYMLKRLKITENLFGKFSKELAEANLEVSAIYHAIRSHRESLFYCYKALETYLTCSGDGTALDHNQLSLKLSKKLGDAPLSIQTEIDAAHILNQLGRSDEAVQTLADIVSRTEELSLDRVSALTHLAEAFLKLEKYADAKDCAEIVREIIGEKENTSVSDASRFVDIARVYERLNEVETALSLLREAIVIIQGETRIPAPIMKPYLEEVSKRFLSSLLLTRSFEEAVPFLEAEVEIAKTRIGLKHVEVGLAYGKLGSTYFEVNKLQLAAQAFACAKDILDESLGLHHHDSIMMCMSLSTVYKAMGSYSCAIKYVEETNKRLEIEGPNEVIHLAITAILMVELEEVASEEDANDSQSGSIPNTNKSKKKKKKAIKCLKISKMKKINDFGSSSISEAVDHLKISK